MEPKVQRILADNPDIFNLFTSENFHLTLLFRLLRDLINARQK